MRKITRTVPSKGYVEPTRMDIQNRFGEIGFKLPYSHDLVRDMANAYSHVLEGGTSVKSFVDLAPQLSGIEDPDERAKAETYHTNVQAFIQSLDWSAFQGDTPLQKAASVVSFLSTQEGGEPGEGGEGALPIFQEGDAESMKEKAKKLEEDIEMFVEANKSLAKYLINPDEKNPVEAMRSLTSEQKDLIAKLALLGDRGKIKARRTSAEQKMAQMAEYSQVSRMLSLTQMSLPTFGYKFASKQLVVREPRQTARQSLVLLIDNSGSMEKIEKLAWVKALLVNRLDAVAKGEGELYIGWFESDIDESSIVKISNKSEAREFLQRDFIGNFDGNETNIERAVQTTIDMMSKGKLGQHKLNAIKPQIVVINDGNDIVRNFEPSVPTHGFILGQDNDGMKYMCQSSGGIYERFL